MMTDILSHLSVEGIFLKKKSFTGKRFNFEKFLFSVHALSSPASHLWAEKQAISHSTHNRHF